MTEQSSKQVYDKPRNPTGKGGFKDNPQNISRDGRPKNEQRFGYWLQFFKNLTTEEFINYTEERPEAQMYMAESIAYERVRKSKKNLPEYKEVADRTEGRAKQTFEHEGQIVESVSIRIIKDAAELEVNGSLPKDLPEPKENNS